MVAEDTVSKFIARSVDGYPGLRIMLNSGAEATLNIARGPQIVLGYKAAGSKEWQNKTFQ